MAYSCSDLAETADTFLEASGYQYRYDEQSDTGVYELPNRFKAATPAGGDSVHLTAQGLAHFFTSTWALQRAAAALVAAQDPDQLTAARNALQSALAEMGSAPQ